MKDEYKHKCDDCEKSGDHMFARLFYKKIDGVWKWLCSKCWNKHNKN